MDVLYYDSRLTPYHKAHSTYVVALHDNPGGDVRFINNLFVSGGDASQYSKTLLPAIFDGNVYTKGSVMPTISRIQRRFGEMNKDAREQLKKYKDQDAIERNTLINDFDASVNLVHQNDGMYLEIALDKNWLTKKRKLITTKELTKAIIPKLPFENVDGSPVKIDTDYSGKKRNKTNPFPGPFEVLNSGKQRIKLW
jgi:alpha-N-arabinofuranosidase